MTGIPKIAAVSAGGAPRNLTVTWEGGLTETIDLSSLIDRHALYAPLDQAATFRKVRVGEWGHHVEWPDDIDMPAHTLWRLAREQAGDTLSVEAFKDIRHRLGLSQAQLGERLGLSKRMIIHYEQGTHIVPKATALALRALEAGLTIRAA